MEPTYDNLKSIVKSEKIDGQQVIVEFQSPGQDKPMESRSVVAADTSEVVKDAGKKAVKRGVFSALISGVSRALGGAVGGGIGGSVASSAASSAGHAAVRDKNSHEVKVNITPEKQQAAVVEAFKSVQSMYDWDEGSNAWKCNLPTAG